MDNTGMNTKYMSIDNVLARLSNLKYELPHGRAMDALETAIDIISALQDEGVNDAEALKDLIFDYKLAVKQNQQNHRKFETAAKAVKRDGVWHCPECNHRVQPKHTFCHRCGKRLGGW